MNLVDFYLVAGGEYQEVFSRLPGDGLIHKFVVKFKDDDTFQNLVKAVDVKNYEEAFRASHTMKGLCLTLGFGNLCKHSSELTEFLRNNNEVDEDQLKVLLKEVEKEYDQLIENIDKIEL